MPDKPAGRSEFYEQGSKALGWLSDFYERGSKPLGWHSGFYECVF